MLTFVATTLGVLVDRSRRVFRLSRVETGERERRAVLDSSATNKSATLCRRSFTSCSLSDCRRFTRPDLQRRSNAVEDNERKGTSKRHILGRWWDDFLSLLRLEVILFLNLTGSRTTLMSIE